MRRDAALADAFRQARETGKPYELWEHTGGGKVLPQQRFIARPFDAPPPQHGRWTRVAVVSPNATPTPTIDRYVSVSEAEMALALSKVFSRWGSHESLTAEDLAAHVFTVLEKR